MIEGHMVVIAVLASFGAGISLAYTVLTWAKGKKENATP